MTQTAPKTSDFRAPAHVALATPTFLKNIERGLDASLILENLREIGLIIPEAAGAKATRTFAEVLMAGQASKPAVAAAAPSPGLRATFAAPTT